jgi:hypothetical protein
MEETKRAEVEFQLRKLFTKYQDLFLYHQWPSEHDRWITLGFALISRAIKNYDKAKEAMVAADNLGLLDAGLIAKIPLNDGEIDLADAYARRIFEILSEAGFSEEESMLSLLVLQELADNLRKNHGGKVQRYLRKYGENMIEELPQNISISKMGEADVKFAFVYWLQNVLNMPILLANENVNNFCDKFGINYQELVEVADNLDINLALLDDLINVYMKDLGKEASKEEL